MHALVGPHTIEVSVLLPKLSKREIEDAGCSPVLAVRVPVERLSLAAVITRVPSASGTRITYTHHRGGHPGRGEHWSRSA